LLEKKLGVYKPSKDDGNWVYYPVIYRRKSFKMFVYQKIANIFSLVQSSGTYRRHIKKIYRPKLVYDGGEGLSNRNKKTLKFSVKNSWFTVGWVYFTTNGESEWKAHGLTVRSPYRGLGIGERLMSEVLNYCKKKNIASVLINVRKDNTIALGLYEKIGFERIKEVDDCVYNPDFRLEYRF